jgi:formate dehydrogenase major subunit
MRPFRISGRTVHQVGLPYHYGYGGIATGDGANDLLPIAMDPNVHIGEFKVATCDIVAGRRPRGEALRDFVDNHTAGRDSAAGGSTPTAGRDSAAGGSTTAGRDSAAGRGKPIPEG